MSRWRGQATLESIRRDLGTIANDRGWGKHHTPRNLMLALQKEVSNLSKTIQLNTQVSVGLKGWNESEKSTLANEIAEVLAYTIRLADKCGIDAEASIMTKLQPPEPVEESTIVNNSAAERNSQLRYKRTAPTSPLSPKSLNDFPQFAGMLGGSDLTELEVMWCAPYDGRIINLIPDGRNIPVKAEYLPLFVKYVNELQQKGMSYVPQPMPSMLTKAAAMQRRSTSPVVKKFTRSLSVQLPHDKKDGRPDNECFSPTHFEHGLFSPANTKTDFGFDDDITLPVKSNKISGDISPRSPGVRLTPVRRRNSVASIGSEEEEGEYKGLDLLIEVAEETRTATATGCR